MIKLYHAPRTRSVRVVWLLEELGLPYELQPVVFQPPTKTFSQSTPLGKLPVLEDGAITMCESGAIVQYILERYAAGRLQPALDSPERGPFLQWIHFAEGTAYPPLGTIVWHTFYKGHADTMPLVIEDAHERAHSALSFLDEQLGDRQHLLDSGFSAADVMMGFTLAAASLLGVLDDRYPHLGPYFQRLQQRPAFQKALAS